jgi:hypothetical protein
MSKAMLYHKTVSTPMEDTGKMQLNQEVTCSDVLVERCSDAITIVPQDCFEIATIPPRSDPLESQSQALLGIDPGLTPPRIQNLDHTAIRTPSSDYELTLSLHPMLNSLLSRRMPMINSPQPMVLQHKIQLPPRRVTHRSCMLNRPLHKWMGSTA